jgi:hypothetical protein
VLNDVVSIVVPGDGTHSQVIAVAIQADGACWCGVTVWQGKTAMRVSVIS